MVKRGLKAGQTFEDGGCTYKVLSVNPNGSYISTKCDDTYEEEKTTNEVSEKPQENEKVSEKPLETKEPKPANNTSRRRKNAQ